MSTQCSKQGMLFEVGGGRVGEARFDGGRVTSDGGGFLLAEVDRKLRLCERLAECFQDQRDPDLVEHPVLDLLRQRIYALCLGYEDLNDHDWLRVDPMLAAIVGKSDPFGEKRRRDPVKPLAGKSTLNRLELTPVSANPRFVVLRSPPTSAPR